MRLRWLPCGAGSAAGIMVPVSVLAAAPAQARPGTAVDRHPLRAGSVTIPPCKATRLAWCTRITVPLDYQDRAAGHIKLGFQWYPATSGHAVGTVLAVQGGPGFPTTDYAADYRGTFRPLLARRNLLLGRPPITTPPPYAPPRLPVLALSGDLDSLTTPAEGRRATADMGPSARWILVPEVRVVGNFPAALRQVVPARPGPGNRAGITGLRLAAVGWAAAGDAAWRWYYGDGVRGWGLRGGMSRFTGSGTHLRIRLTRVRWTTDTRVTGTVGCNQVSGLIRARLTITGRHRGAASAQLRYSGYVPHSTATRSGRYRGQPAAQLPAP